MANCLHVDVSGVVRIGLDEFMHENGQGYHSCLTAINPELRGYGEPGFSVIIIHSIYIFDKF
jgi:hypothetical protein